VKKPVLRATQVVMVNQNFSVILEFFFVKCGVHKLGDTIRLYVVLLFTLYNYLSLVISFINLLIWGFFKSSSIWVSLSFLWLLTVDMSFTIICDPNNDPSFSPLFLWNYTPFLFLCKQLTFPLTFVKTMTPLFSMFKALQNIVFSSHRVHCKRHCVRHCGKKDIFQQTLQMCNTRLRLVRTHLQLELKNIVFSRLDTKITILKWDLILSNCKNNTLDRDLLATCRPFQTDLPTRIFMITKIVKSTNITISVRYYFWIKWMDKFRRMNENDEKINIQSSFMYTPLIWNNKV